MVSVYGQCRDLRAALVPHADLQVHLVQRLVLWPQLPSEPEQLPAVHSLTPALSHQHVDVVTQQTIDRSCRDVACPHLQCFSTIGTNNAWLRAHSAH